MASQYSPISSSSISSTTPSPQGLRIEEDEDENPLLNLLHDAITDEEDPMPLDNVDNANANNNQVEMVSSQPNGDNNANDTQNTEAQKPASPSPPPKSNKIRAPSPDSSYQKDTSSKHRKSRSIHSSKHRKFRSIPSSNYHQSSSNSKQRWTISPIRPQQQESKDKSVSPPPTKILNSGRVVKFDGPNSSSPPPLKILNSGRVVKLDGLNLPIPLNKIHFPHGRPPIPSPMFPEAPYAYVRK
jgi:hypothetical protein